MARRLGPGALMSLLLLGLLSSATLAGEPGPGKFVEVTCRAAPDQKYSCYLPKAYSREKEWPILYCFSPDAHGELFVQLYRAACEERGWIVVGSLNSRNGPWEPIKAAIDAIAADTAERFKLSETRRYASGFSGGARVSFGFAEMFEEQVAGVIAIGAGLHSGGKLPKKELAVWLMCGESDFNRTEIEALAPRLREAGNPVEVRNFPGAHTMPPADLMTEAVQWMDDQSSARQKDRLAAAFAEAGRLAEAGEAVPAWMLLADTLTALPEVREGRKEAEKLLKSLERDDAVKNEVKALEKLEKARAFLSKNAGRIEKSDSVRARAAKGFEDVVEKFPGTRAAEQAAAEVSRLAAPGD